MVVESAADRAAMMTTDDWGEDWTFTPIAGGPVVKRVMPTRGSREAGDFGSAGLISDHRSLFVFKDEIAVIAKDDQFNDGTTDFEVSQTPTLDDTGELWTVYLREVTP